ncbi:carbon starvation CstA family protein [Catenisphaera adipataccumulans]|jgi:carbon starvation protein|uniref:Carbon starvation protein n=1 Tax=Catenisphaera adipataccumulans TaxID=700500 RepID=A0A7W8CY89_9FIRM|nr:carbon starvation protein A [Catenisphaera adipataccumulans]MBB5182477.1 carbon starvation protein [Catenisphaera adipataccumulans]
MNAAVLLLIGIAVLACGYLFYGRWLAKTWGIDPNRKTPAYEYKDDVDYMPAKPAVLMGHHFSSIAGAGPITGPVQAAVFGWVPVVLWILVGGIFFGGVHDFGALFASVRHKGQSIGEIIADTMGTKMKKMFMVFAYLTLLLVVAAFASMVAGTFSATFKANGTVDMAASASNATTAMISLLFIVLAIIFGFMIYRRNAPLLLSTILGCAGIVLIIAIGMNYHPFYLSNATWMIIIGIYIAVASIVPVWLLLQPRDYLSSFLLYFMMIVAVLGILGSHPSIASMPMFTGFYNETQGYLFPALFVTIACGAISGFHSLVSSGTTSKQLDNEKHALPIAYGSMLIECVLGICTVCAVSYIWTKYAGGEITNPMQVFSIGIASMVASIPGLSGTQSFLQTMLILAISVFCLTSLDTATRLARYTFQEFWLDEGETVADATGYKKVLTNPYLATIITVVLGIGLGMTGYLQIWPLFGASNQLLAAVGLLAVATWLGKVGKNNKMFYFPMIFMLIVTVTSLTLTVRTNVANLSSGLATDPGWDVARTIIAVVLIVLAIILAIDSLRTIVKQNKAKKAA